MTREGRPEVKTETNSELHREGGPTIIRPDGTQVWYLNGECHREDGPAIIGSDGSEKWFLNGAEQTTTLRPGTTHSHPR